MREYPDGSVEMWGTKRWNTPGGSATTQEFVYPIDLKSAKVVGLVLQTSWPDSILVSVSAQSNASCTVNKYLKISGVGHTDSVTVHVMGVREGH